MASLAWTIDFDYSVGEIKNEVGYTMTALLVFYVLTRERSICNFWNAILAASFAAMTTIAISRYVLDGDDSWTQGGVQGGVGTFSTYVVVVFPFLLAAGLRASRGSAMKRQVWLIVPILAFYVASLTENRAVWPALIAQLAIFTGFALRRGVPVGKRTFVVATMVMAAIALQQFVAVVKHKAPTEVSAVEALAAFGKHDVRPMVLWTLALERIEDRPVLGYGFGRGILRKNISEDKMLWHTHNLLLDYALQLGIAGVVVIAVVFASLAREFWKLTRLADAELQLIGVGGVALVAGVLLKNMTDDFFIRENALLFWTLVGMSLGYATRAVLRSTSQASSSGPA
jgi:O-antigen ligase